ncbi:MAG: potassium channel family protein, partial [Planctomycetota bacterium]
FRGPWVWPRLVAVVLVLLAVHSTQIVVFGGAYHLLDGSAAGLEGDYDDRFADAVYFSAMVYTTVGFGDITPEGHLRLLVSLEAITGLMLIAWSASFTFLVMQKLADDDTAPSRSTDANPDTPDVG